MTKKKTQNQDINKNLDKSTDIEEETVDKIEQNNENQDSVEQDLRTQLAEAQQSTKDNWDKVLRSQAEMENLKRRNARDLENAHKFALDGFVKALLEVNDSITTGIKSVQQDKIDIKHIAEGLEMTNKIFINTMQKFGVDVVNPKDEIFNPKLHEAVTMIAAKDKKSNTVLEVVQIGFTLNGRLVRPAMVVVAQ